MHVHLVVILTFLALLFFFFFLSRHYDVKTSIFIIFKLFHQNVLLDISYIFHTSFTNLTCMYNWLLDLEEYFNFWKICDEERVWLTSNKLDNEVDEWWEDIQIDRKWQGKHPTCSWQRMKMY